MSQTVFPILQAADIKWREGLPVSRAYGDVYFSLDGGLEESTHVFLEGNNLSARFRALKAKQFYILETGFGSGLNALLTFKLWLDCAPKEACLFYTSIEKHPFTLNDLIQALSLWPQLEPVMEPFVRQYPALVHGMHRLSLFDGRVELTLMFMDVTQALDALLQSAHPNYEAYYQPALIDAWFLDGFAPSKNAEMWQSLIFERMAMLSKDETSVASFTVARQVKEALTQNGFQIQKRPGFGKKRECLSARYRPIAKSDASQRRYNKARTPWHRPFAQKVSPKQIAIIGAGLSGAMLAYSLRNKGLDIRVYEASSTAGSGGSGNAQAVLYPRFSAYRSALTEWFLQAFLFAKQQYPELMKRFSIPGSLEGIAILSEQSDIDYADDAQRSYLESHFDLLRYLDAEQLSNLTGVELNQSGIWVLGAGWLDAKILCQRLLEASGARLIYNSPLEDLQYDAPVSKWDINGTWQADAVVLCNAFAARHFAQTAHLPLKAIPGQLSFITPSEDLQGLRMPLCGEGHVLPVYEQRQALGATYHPKGGAIDTDLDNQRNLDKLSKLGLVNFKKPHVIGAWSASRAVTPDYLPILGPVAVCDAFKEIYAPFRKNAKAWVGEPPVYYPGLYAMAGFGSRGLTSAPLAAQYLKNLILGEPSCLTQALEQALSAQRFMYRALCRNAL